MTDESKTTEYDPGYEWIDHTADLAVVIRGRDLRDLFFRSAFVIADLVVENRVGYSGNGVTETLTVAGEDLSDLMFNWLREILYYWNGKGLIITGVSIRSFTDFEISADIEFVPYDPGIHEIKNEIKAATYHELEVKREGDGFSVQVVFDL